MSDLAISSKSPFIFREVSRDILAELLADKRSENTRRAYARLLTAFFQHIANQDPTPELVNQFLALDRDTAIKLVINYKASLIERKLSESSVNQHLSAVKSLVKFAQILGRCEWSLEAVKGEKTVGYRDTSGITPAEFAKLFGLCDRTSLQGKRNYALLRLLWDNVLRRGEICNTTVGDFSRADRTLLILGKGRGTQREKIDLSEAATEALYLWLRSRRSPGKEEPLFISLDNAHFGHALTPDGLYRIISTLAKQAKIKKKFSPHRCRHSGITAALDATSGDVRAVQKLSRHSKIETLLIYDDNREAVQGQLSELLSGLAK